MGDDVDAGVAVRLGDFVAVHAQQGTGGTWQLESKKMPEIAPHNATVAWPDGMQTSVKADVNPTTLIGRSSGETFQMRFDGQGFVVVQPYEEVVAANGGGS